MSPVSLVNWHKLSDRLHMDLYCTCSMWLYIIVFFTHLSCTCFVTCKFWLTLYLSAYQGFRQTLGSSATTSSSWHYSTKNSLDFLFFLFLLFLLGTKSGISWQWTSYLARKSVVLLQSGRQWSNAFLGQKQKRWKCQLFSTAGLSHRGSAICA